MGISILFARGLIGEVVRRGFDAKSVLEDSGIHPERLDDVRDMLSLTETARLVDRAVTLTSDPALGLTAGASAPDHAVQVFGHLILAQGTIREAFATLSRYGTLLSDGTTWTLLERDDYAMWSCSTLLREGALIRLLMDYTFAFTANIGRHFFPPGERLRAVHFQHPAPSYAERYTEVFHCPVLFEQEHNATVFSRVLLDRRKLHADATVDGLLRETADRLLQERSHHRSLTDAVRVLLRNERELPSLDMRQVARLLRLSVHSLRRKLSAEGTSFSILLDEARCQIARQHLTRPGTTIQQTAEVLGFSETSAFFRAFKRWTGQTPTEFRRRSVMPAAASGASSSMLGDGGEAH
jgi:AraC-like DNA-binding protein